MVLWNTDKTGEGLNWWPLVWEAKALALRLWSPTQKLKHYRKSEAVHLISIFQQVVRRAKINTNYIKQRAIGKEHSRTLCISQCKKHPPSVYQEHCRTPWRKQFILLVTRRKSGGPSEASVDKIPLHWYQLRLNKRTLYAVVSSLFSKWCFIPVKHVRSTDWRILFTKSFRVQHKIKQNYHLFTSSPAFSFDSNPQLSPSKQSACD